MARNSLKNVCRLVDQAKDALSPEQSFLADLKRSIELEANANKRKPSPYYKPSSLKCIRNMYYQRTGADPERDDENYTGVGITNSGTDIHLRVQHYVESMKEHGFDCEYIDVADFVRSRNLDYLEIKSKSGMETKLFHKDLQMSFLCDGIIRYMNHYYILELKTEASFKFQNRKGVDPSHFAQGTAYSIAFGLPEVIFVYISRDLLDMKAYMFVPTDEQKMNLIGKIEECDQYVSQLRCPEKPEDVDRRTCAYCSYRERCNKDG